MTDNGRSAWGNASLQSIKVDGSCVDVPFHWYNVTYHLPEPLPPVLDPKVGPSRIELRQRMMPRALQRQDTETQEWLDIPGEVREKYAQLGRPTPLQRATALEAYLETPAHIYYKREDVFPTGSFKMNSAIPQAYYARQEGYAGLVSQTGAGQWGSGLTLGCRMFGLRCIIYMARVSFFQKPYRRIHMQLLGGEVYPSPSERTEAGRKMLAEHPDHPGSVNSGISEAFETAMSEEGFAYVTGSNSNHTLIHNTVIGLESRLQLEVLDEAPDQLIACVGGGSNLGGLMLPFLSDRLQTGRPRLLAAESAAAPRLTQGEYRYDSGDPAGLTPLIKTYTLGSDFIPPVNHVGGLRQHGGSPLVSLLKHIGLLEARAYGEKDALEAGHLFARLEGVVPAPETSHAIRAAIEEALDAKRLREKRVMVIGFSGHGLLDLGGYEQVLFPAQAASLS